ncbi:histone-lysine N-methyltransferase SETMAR [Trichonephila clavipes]|nr:histone-lysine N-methyltransferase SETMAR [Trichonephila clavipes]
MENVRPIVTVRLVRHHTLVTTIDDLWHRVGAQWVCVPINAIQSMFESMPRRKRVAINSGPKNPKDMLKKRRVSPSQVAPRTSRLIIENVDKMTKIIHVVRHLRCRSIAQELNIDHKTVSNHLSKIGFKKKLDSQTLNPDLYCQQLHRLKLAIDSKWQELANRRGVVFHQDNAMPHTNVVTRQKLWELGWNVLMHPPYSSDLAPNDYHLSFALKNFLSYKKFESREDCENRLLEFFANKDHDFSRATDEPPSESRVLLAVSVPPASSNHLHSPPSSFHANRTFV